MKMKNNDEYNVWLEYDMVAEDMAKRGLTGKPGDPLPQNIGAPCLDAINADIEAFEARVRACAYALSMESLSLKNPKEG